MINKESYIGYWWLPNKEKKKVYGSLNFTEDGDFILETIGHFSGKDFNTHFSNSRDFPIVFGIARDSKSNYDFSFKLLNCLIINNAINKINYCKTVVTSLLKSRSTNLNENLEFDSALIRPKNIDRWVSLEGFENSYYDNSGNNINIDYKKPNETVLVDNDDYKILIDFSLQYSLPNEEGFSLDQKAYLLINFKKKWELESIKKLIKSLQNFFTFSINHPVDIEECYFKVNYSSLKENHESVNYNYYQKNRFVDKRYKKVQKFDMLFTMDDVKKELPNVLSNWLENYKNITYIHKNLFSTIYNSYLYQENTFLNYVFALEIYHRNKFIHQNFKGENYLKKRRNIIDKISNRSDKEWLIARLNRKTEKSLKNRLNHLIEIYKDSFIDIFEADELFVNKIVETRHYLVHENVKFKELIITNNSELYEFTEKISIIIKAILMNEIGFNESFINLNLKKSVRGMRIFNK